MATTLYRAYEQYADEVAAATRDYRTSIRKLSEDEFAEFVKVHSKTVSGRRLLLQIQDGFHKSCENTATRFANAIKGQQTRKAA